MEQKVKISELNPACYSRVVEICNHVIGSGYLNMETLHFLLFSEGYKGIVAYYGEELAGFCIWKTFEHRNQMPENMREIESVQSLPPEKCIGYIKLIGVKSHLQRKGIGTSMMDICLEEIIKLCGTILCTAWKNREGTNLETILKSRGFKLQQTIEKFWYRSSLENGFSCASCGKPPCLCSLDLYVLFVRTFR